GLLPDIKRGLEIKCRPTNHIDVIMKNEYLKNDYTQCQYSLWITGYDSWDLLYYHPNMPDNYMGKIFNIKPNKIIVEKFDARVKAFCDLAEKYVNKMSRK